MLRSNASVGVFNGDLNSALKKLKKSLAQGGTLTEMKRHASYLKPGEARRVKEKKARKRERKNIAKAAQREAARMARGER